MMERIADTLLTIPFQSVQEIPNRMKRILVCDNMHGFFNHLQGTNAIRSVTIQMDVVQIIIGQSISIEVPIPSQRFHDIHPLRQLIVTDRSFEKGITGQDRFYV